MRAVAAVPLRGDGTTPIVIPGDGQGLADGGDFLGGTAGGGDIAGTGGADGFGVMHEGFGVAKSIPREPCGLEGERGGGLPIVTLQGIAGGRGGEGVGCGELIFVEHGEGVHFSEHFLRTGVVRLLEVGVDEVVRGVELIEGASAAVEPQGLGDAGFRGDRVGGDGIVPQAEAGEDVRGHVEGVRRIGRDDGVGTGGFQAEFGEGRIIDAVNDVVGDAGVVLVARQELIEDVAAALLPGVGLVSGVEIADGYQLEGVEDGGFVIVRIAGADTGEGDFVVLRAGGVVYGGPVFVKDGEGVEVIVFSGSAGGNGECAGQSCGALLQFVGRRGRPDGVIPSAGDTPECHGAGWVGRGGIVKGETGFFIAEGMEQCGGRGR